MISFAGGLPSAASFPALPSELQREWLQYGPSEGERALRIRIAERLRRRGLNIRPERVLILSGSQQGIDLVAKLVIDRDTPVAVESPTYLSALQVFTLFGARYLPFHPEHVGRELAAHVPRLLYTVPTFRNPDTVCYTLNERRAIARACDANDTILFEDDPYRDLVYEPCERTPVCSLVKNADWIYQGSLSKTLAPGLRLGYLVCSERLYPSLLKLKQAADLHSSRVSQGLAIALLDAGDDETRLASICDAYREQRDAFETELHTYFGDLATWHRPAGGLFFWLSLKDGRPIDTRTLLPQALDRGVAFMPGEAFYPEDRPARSRFRLNFSHAPRERVADGLSKLAALFEESLCA